MGQPVCAANASPAEKVLQEGRPLCQGELEGFHGGKDIETGFNRGRWERGAFQGVSKGREVGKHTAFMGNRGECRGAEGGDPE